MTSHSIDALSPIHSRTLISARLNIPTDRKDMLHSEASARDVSLTSHKDIAVKVPGIGPSVHDFSDSTATFRITYHIIDRIPTSG